MERDESKTDGDTAGLNVRRVVDENHVREYYARIGESVIGGRKVTVKSVCKSIREEIVWGVYGNHGQLEELIDISRVERLTPKDCGAFKSLYLEGVTEIPENFGRSIEDVQETTTCTFEEFLKDNYVVGVKYMQRDSKEEETSLVGMINLQREEGTRSHRAKLGGLYVGKAHRGRGLATGMTMNTLDHALTIDGGGIDVTELIVTATNKYVIEWYERIGFQRDKIQYNAAKVNGVSYDWQYMSLDMKTYREKRGELMKAQP